MAFLLVSSEDSDNNVIYIMSGILGTLLSILYGLIILQDKKQPSTTTDFMSFLPDPKIQPSKNAYELYTWRYTVIWILCFGCIVVFQLYEKFTSFHYNLVCVGLSLPFLLQPILYPQISTTLVGISSPDADRALLRRYSFKANVWIAIFSFIGNYWYTHYFYSVLKAEYTFLTSSTHRLNNVPIALFFATHFYFSTYHALSNYCLRKVTLSYQPGWKRSMLFATVVFVLSYITAFMETLTISSFPYYQFEDRFMAYTAGSAFYSIYFIVSFPMFYLFDDEVDRGIVMENGSMKRKNDDSGGFSVWRTIIDSCACGMIVLCLLDFVRIYLDIPLIIGN